MKFDDTLSPEGVGAPTMHRRAVSVASRLLGGSGRADLFAFRLEPQRTIEVLAHGLLPDGRFVVATVMADGADGVLGHGHVDVRLDVEKDAPLADLRIRAATLHALGRLSWLDETFPGQAGVVAELPALVAGLVGLPGVRIGTVDLARVLLHDSAGVVPLAWREIREEGLGGPFPQFMDELSAAEEVGSLPTAHWVRIIEGVLTGRVPGQELKRWETPAMSDHTGGSVRCVDVDETGVTVMHFTAMEATTVFVPFATAARDVEGVREGLHGLLARCDALA